MLRHVSVNNIVLIFAVRALQSTARWYRNLDRFSASSSTGYWQMWMSVSREYRHILGVVTIIKASERTSIKNKQTAFWCTLSDLSAETFPEVVAYHDYYSLLLIYFADFFSLFLYICQTCMFQIIRLILKIDWDGLSKCNMQIINSWKNPVKNK